MVFVGWFPETQLWCLLAVSRDPAMSLQLPSGLQTCPVNLPLALEICFVFSADSTNLPRVRVGILNLGCTHAAGS